MNYWPSCNSNVICRLDIAPTSLALFLTVLDLLQESFGTHFIFFSRTVKRKMKYLLSSLSKQSEGIWRKTTLQIDGPFRIPSNCTVCARCETLNGTTSPKSVVFWKFNHRPPVATSTDFQNISEDCHNNFSSVNFFFYKVTLTFQSSHVKLTLSTSVELSGSSNWAYIMSTPSMIYITINYVSCCRCVRAVWR